MSDKWCQKQWPGLWMERGQYTDDEANQRECQEEEGRQSPCLLFGQPEAFNRAIVTIMVGVFEVFGCKVSQPYRSAAP